MICLHEISISMNPRPNVQTVATSIDLMYHTEPYTPHQWLKDTFIYPLRISYTGALTREAGPWLSSRA